MIKDFTTYHQALKLKALGFDEQCDSFFQKEYHEVTPVMVDDNDQYRLTGMRTCKNSEIPEHYTAAPTFSQAFRFFREKYNFSSEINVYSISGGYSYSFKILCKRYTPYIEANNNWLTYEEAELACLDKLIEITETK